MTDKTVKVISLSIPIDFESQFILRPLLAIIFEVRLRTNQVSRLTPLDKSITRSIMAACINA